jgi:hypothetical protein
MKEFRIASLFVCYTVDSIGENEGEIVIFYIYLLFIHVF